MCAPFALATPSMAPVIFPLFVSVVIVPLFCTPRPLAAGTVTPLAPEIVAPAELVSAPIVAPLPFCTPTAPAIVPALSNR